MDDKDTEERDRGVAWALWARVDQLRINLGLSTLEFTTRAGVRRQTYMDLQYTTRRPRRDIVMKIAATSGLDTDEALKLAGLSPVDADTVRRTILDAYDRNPQQKDALLALLSHYEAGVDHTPPPAPVKPPRRRRQDRTASATTAIAA